MRDTPKDVILERKLSHICLVQSTYSTEEWTNKLHTLEEYGQKVWRRIEISMLETTAQGAAKGKVPVHQVNSLRTGKCRKPSCDYWRPLERVKHKSDEGCKCREKCAFLHSDNNEAPSKRSKKYQKSEKSTAANVRSNQGFGFVCHRTLIGQNKRLDLRTWDSPSCKRSPRTPLKLKKPRLRKDSSNIGNHWDHL